MATAAALKSIDSLTGVDARMEALDRLKRLTDEAAAEATDEALRLGPER